MAGPGAGAVEPQGSGTDDAAGAGAATPPQGSAGATDGAGAGGGAPHGSLAGAAAARGGDEPQSGAPSGGGFLWAGEALFLHGSLTVTLA